jgi:nitrogen regulatory protein P-II 2
LRGHVVDFEGPKFFILEPAESELPTSDLLQAAREPNDNRAAVNSHQNTLTKGFNQPTFSIPRLVRNRRASTMKYIIAVIQPHRLDAVREALSAIGVQGLTVTEVRGFGRQKGQTEIYRGAEYTMHYVPKVKLEIAVPAVLADRVVETIGEGARTGRIGDGKVFVLDLEGVMRVRTGEMGADAL